MHDISLYNSKTKHFEDDLRLNQWLEIKLKNQLTNLLSVETIHEDHPRNDKLKHLWFNIK